MEIATRLSRVVGQRRQHKASFQPGPHVGSRDKDLLLYLTFGQTVLMQTVGRYFW